MTTRARGGALAQWFRRTRLSVKLALLGAAVTAAVVFAVFWVLGVEIRANTRRLFANELARSQRALLEIQRRNLTQLLFSAELIAQSPGFRYTMETYRMEANVGGAPRPDLAAMLGKELADYAASARRDLLITLDDSGRVFAASVRGAAAPPLGTDLSRVPAVRRVLDPAARADTGDMAVLRVGEAYFQVGVYPVVLHGFTVGALAVGERVDATVATALQRALAGDGAGRRRDARGGRVQTHVVITAGRGAGAVVVGTTLPLVARERDAVVRLVRAEPAGPGRDSSSTVRLGEEEYVVASLPYGDSPDGAPVRLWLLEPLGPAVRPLTQALLVDFLSYGALAILVAGLGASLLTRSVLRPFQAFIGHMRSAAAAGRVERPFDDADAALEVRALNASFTHVMDSLAKGRDALEQRTREVTAANVVLTEEIRERERVELALRESEAQLRQSQKLEAIGTLAGGIAHDFNNLLTVISGYTQLALLRLDRGGAVAEDLKQVVEASERAAKLTHQLLAFSRKQVLQPRVLDLDDVVGGVAPMLRRLIGEHIELRIEPVASPESGTTLPRIRAERGQLEQVIINLVVNARDAMSAGGTITIATREETGGDSATRTGRRGVVMTVRDTGSGMPASVRERIFEPFFTTKDLGKGTGLGLSTVYGIVNQSGGTIAVDSEPGQGTTFTMTLPAVTELDPRDVEDEAPGPPPRGSETVLLVEDEDEVRALARRTLEDCGYRVLAARGGVEALELAQRAERPIDVLLSDIVMPHLSGPQLVDRFITAYGPPIVIYMSGYADDALMPFELDPGTAFLRKPFTPYALARVVRDALDAATPTAGVGQQR